MTNLVNVTPTHSANVTVFYIKIPNMNVAFSMFI